MAVNNSITKTDGKSQVRFGQLITTEGYQKSIRAALADPKRAMRFQASLVSTVAQNPLLGICEPKSILSAALQGEALELSPSPTLGEYYLVPYKKKVKDENGNWTETYICQFQIGTAGRVQLAMRSGQYKSLYAIEIREGEYRGRDSENARPLFKFEADDEKREKLPIIGYLAFYELINGFRHSVYFSKEKCINWAERYSKSFDRKLYDRVKAGEAITDWKEKNAAEAPWIKHTDEMCKNLVLRQVLKNAPKSVEMRNLLDGDEKTDDEITPVVSTPATQQGVEDDFFTPIEVKDVDVQDEAKAPKSTRKKADESK